MTRTPAALLLLAAALTLPAASPAAAQVQTSGYLKNLYQYSRDPLSGSPYWLDLTRARLGLEAAGRAGPVGLLAHADYDHELRAGSYLHSASYEQFGLNEPPTYLDMQQTIAEGRDASYRHRLYRGWVEASKDETHVRFGRQRIAWGTGRLWNPTDFLNPYQPTSVERNERSGVDAVYARRALGEVGQAETAYTLSRNWAGSNLIARVHGNRSGVDLSALGGKVAGSTGSWIAGGDFATDVAGGSLHGEASLVGPQTRGLYGRFLIGYDYTFPAEAGEALKDLWALVEYYRNGAGTLHASQYNFAQLQNGSAISLARDYLGLGLRKELHPLLTLEIYEITNLDDGSWFWAPSLDWNARQNLHLTAGWQRFGGANSTEYGKAPNIFFLQGQFFF